GASPGPINSGEMAGQVVLQNVQQPGRAWQAADHCGRQVRQLLQVASHGSWSNCPWQFSLPSSRRASDNRCARIELYRRDLLADGVEPDDGPFERWPLSFFVGDLPTDAE